MTAWTVERLDALPEGTVIEFGKSGGHAGWTYIKSGMGQACWLMIGRDIRRTSADLAGSIDLRVVSVPIDALLHPVSASGSRLQNADFRLLARGGGGPQANGSRNGMNDSTQRIKLTHIRYFSPTTTLARDVSSFLAEVPSFAEIEFDVSTNQENPGNGESLGVMIATWEASLSALENKTRTINLDPPRETKS